LTQLSSPTLLAGAFFSRAVTLRLFPVSNSCRGHSSSVSLPYLYSGVDSSSPCFRIELDYPAADGGIVTTLKLNTAVPHRADPPEYSLRFSQALLPCTNRPHLIAEYMLTPLTLLDPVSLFRNVLPGPPPFSLAS